MVTRRNFLRGSAAALSMMAVRNQCAWAAQHIPIGLQLYTVRSLFQGDLSSLFKQIRGIGYEEVETAGDLYQHPAPELRSMILDAGLTVPAGHFDYKTFPDRLAYAKDLGVKWAICPSIPQPQSPSLDTFHNAAKQFNEWAKLAKDQGMGFAYHNHDFEFRNFGGETGGGKTGYDVLVEETDPALVHFEVDCYWVAQAGIDPLQLLHKLKQRARLLHLKDRKPGFPPSNDTGPSSAHFTEVGQGTIAWKPILEMAKRIGVEYYFVEQDKTDGPPLESIATSYKYLRTLIS
jgi:sugar phosphate isomerase/epimerase